jgi:alpha-ketoglutarate-dependent taurine dioxygenase
MRIQAASGWLGQLEERGYFSCNLGPLTDADLLRAALEVTTLDGRLAPGPVIEVKSVAGSPFRALSRLSLPFHNDGAYLRQASRYVLFYCPSPGSRGGDTLFVRGDLAVTRLSPDIRKLLARTRFSIALGDKRVMRRLIVPHPRDGTPVLFFGDPRTADAYSVSSERAVCVKQILEEVRTVVSAPKWICHRQRWRRHDLLIFDNYRLLHARTAFRGQRVLKRVDIGPD